MGIFINHNSFVILGLIVWVATIYLLSRRGKDERNVIIFLVVTLLLVVGYVFFRPANTANQQVDEITAQIGGGKPVLMQLRSQN